MTRFLSADEAARLIPDGATVATDGFTLLGVAEEVYAAIEARFLSSGSPRGLTVVSATGQSGNELGYEHFAHDGLVARVIGSHWGLQPRMSRFLRDDGAEAICLPQGQISHLYRAIAARRPGNLSRVGLGTFVDPDLGGGRMNSAAASAPSYVDAVEIDGERVLLYRSFPIHVGVIRASTVDDDGNCSFEDEAVTVDALGIAQAVHASRGLVIVQARRRVPTGTLAPRSVGVPASLVDVVVVSSDPERNHRQSHGFDHDARTITASAAPLPVDAFPALAADRLAIGDRAVRDLEPGAVINIGTGIPGDVVGAALARAGLADRVTVTVESGIHGGRPLGGTDFGAALHPSAILSHAQQFDYYDGGGLDATFMGAGEVDAVGNVNVSLLGDRVIGCGGFIDITQSTRRIYFCLSLAGRHRKFVPTVRHLTFNAQAALRNGQEVRYVTERAVFDLVPAGLRVIEVMPGYDLDADVLAEIPFPVEVDPALLTPPASLIESRR